MPLITISSGLGTTVVANRITVIVGPESAPIKRIISEKRELGQLIDATFGRRTRAVLFLDDGTILLSSVQSDTLRERIKEAVECFCAGKEVRVSVADVGSGTD